MPIASRFADGTACVIDGDLVASLVGGRWERGLSVPDGGADDGSAAVSDEDAVMLAMEARAALGAAASPRSAALRGATL
jgi:hypothetical protein